MLIYRIAFFVGIGLLLLGFSWAMLANDPYIFRRFGALTTGYAASLVLLQVYLENSFEASKEATQETDENMSPTKEKWLEKRSRRKFEDYSQKRMTIAIIVALLAFIGEIAHGFGDLVVKLFV